MRNRTTVLVFSSPADVTRETRTTIVIARKAVIMTAAVVPNSRQQTTQEQDQEFLFENIIIRLCVLCLHNNC